MRFQQGRKPRQGSEPWSVCRFASPPRFPVSQKRATRTSCRRQAERPCTRKAEDLLRRAGCEQTPLGNCCGSDRASGAGAGLAPCSDAFSCVFELQQLAAALAEKPKKPVELIGELGNGRIGFVAGSRSGERAFNQSSGVTGGQEVAGSNPVAPTNLCVRNALPLAIKRPGRGHFWRTLARNGSGNRSRAGA